MREVRGETGLEMKPLALVCRLSPSHQPRSKGTCRAAFCDFAVRRALAFRRNNVNEELAEARWLKPSELPELATTEGLAEIVAAAWEKMSASS